MRKKIFIALLCFPILFTSCDPNDNYGYPSKVTFEKEGGTKICSGSISCYHVEIKNYNGNGDNIITKGENDTITVTYDWLTVKFRKFGHAQLEITASPNPGKKRRLYVYGAVDNFDATIKVVQH